MNLIDAINKRKSVRNFANHEIEPDIIERIKNFIDSAMNLYDDCDINFIISDFCRKSFHAPYYVAVYTDERKESLINAGYILEQLVIYLTEIGIATCYQEKTIIFKEEDVQERKLALSLAMGYPAGEMYRKKKCDRLSKNKICIEKEVPSKEVSFLIDYGKIAPSSFNAQPWRYVVYSNRIHVFAKKTHFKKIDRFIYLNMGIMLANISLAAEDKWIEIKFKEIPSIKAKDMGENEYIITVIVDNDDGIIFGN